MEQTKTVVGNFWQLVEGYLRGRLSFGGRGGGEALHEGRTYGVPGRRLCTGGLYTGGLSTREGGLSTGEE